MVLAEVVRLERCSLAMRLCRVALSTTMFVSVLVVGCGRLRYEPADASIDRDAAGLDAAGLDAPGLDAAELDAAGLDAAGLDAAELDVGGDAACVIPTPEAYFPMNEGDLVSSTLFDRSGRGHDGSLLGDVPSVVAGRVGGALDFSSTTLANVEANVPFPGPAHTVSFWMRNDDPAPDQGVLCPTPTPLPEAPRYCLWLTNRSGPISLCINGGTGECWGVTRDDLLGRWVHVVAVFVDGPTTMGRLYLDGVPVTMGCRFGTCDQSRTAQGPLLLGMNEDVYAWRGLLDEVRFYPRALDDTEAAALFACDR